jgi:hypothetical protein
MTVIELSKKIVQIKALGFASTLIIEINYESQLLQSVVKLASASYGIRRCDIVTIKY